MWTSRWHLVYPAIVCLLVCSCSKGDPGLNPISTLSITLNGASLVDGAVNIPTKASVVMVFSAALDPSSFESELSITSASGSSESSITYSNQSSKVTLDLDLDDQTTYTVAIGNGPIGKNGEPLEKGISISFTTIDDGIIHALPACTTGTTDCLQSVGLTENGTAEFHFYSSFPIYEDMAEWLDITAALIVVHGVNRDANNYFNYLMATLKAKNLEDKVVLIAPFFKNASEADDGDYYWAGNAWREGQHSANTAKVSSFGVIDQIIDQLADEDHFPELEKIIVTGQSSGALFTHLYAAANQAEEKHPRLAFEYVVSESQYFYYPDGLRIDESTKQLYTPSGCTGYDIWPIGFNVIPPYLGSMDLSRFNERFVSRSVTYLLGNGTGSDNSLNTNDCYATLLGSSRYQRGENMFRYMELAYPGTHQHSKIIVDGVLHDGSATYQSPEFQALLMNLLE